MQDVRDLFGKRIKELRKEKNMTQEKLAELVDIDTRNIIKIENGQTFPRLKTLEKFLEIFEISASDLFRTEHLQDTAFLKEKILQKLDKDDDLVRLVYKMLF